MRRSGAALQACEDAAFRTNPSPHAKPPCAAGRIHARAARAADADAQRIVGTWKLVSVVYEDAQTKERTMISYSGRYRFEGDRLHLESPPMPHPNIGGRVVRVIVTWEREE